MKFNQLVLGIDENTQRGYLSTLKREYTRMGYEPYIKRLSEMINEAPESFVGKPYGKYAYVTTKVKRSLLGSDKYLIVLDCDSIEDKDRSIDYLKYKKIRHFIIESSPGKFWIIGDKLASAKNHAAELIKLDSLDKNYVICSGKRDTFVLRAFPKPGFTPKFDDTSMFRGKGYFEKWILEFKEYWETEEMKSIANTLFAEAI